jgi:hypothetical protein
MTTPKLHRNNTTCTDYVQALVPFAFAHFTEAVTRLGLLVVLVAGLFVITAVAAFAERSDYGYSFYDNPDKDKPSNTTGGYDPFTGGHDPFKSDGHKPHATDGTWSGDMITTSYVVQEGEWLYGEPDQTDGSQRAGLSWLQYLALAALLTVIWWRHIAVSIKTSWITAVESYSNQLLSFDDDRASGANAAALTWRLTKLITLPPGAFVWVLAGSPELQRLWRRPGY